MSQKRKQKEEKAFTLIELMIVLAIMVVLAILVISGYQEGRPRLALERSTEGVVNDLYRARQRAFSSTVHESGGDLIEDGFGIKIKEGEDSYVFYAGKNEQEEIERIGIEHHVSITEVEPSDNGELRIFFSSEGKTTIFNEGQGSSGKITLFAQGDEGLIRKVNISSSGIITIEYD
jgi:prepilin-type N-terminal cleavage/methylation domain-containing protein